MLVLVMAELNAIMGATRIMLSLVNPEKASDGVRIPKAASRVQQVMVVTPMGTFWSTNIMIINARIATVIYSSIKCPPLSDRFYSHTPFS